MHRAFIGFSLKFSLQLDDATLIHLLGYRFRYYIRVDFMQLELKAERSEPLLR